MKRIAIITPWFGANLAGGAEQQAFQIATRLAARGQEVSVLTTCNRSFLDDWSVNHHEPGETRENGLTIRRFPVDPRAAAAFDRVNAKLLALDPKNLRVGVNPVSDEDAGTFVNENIRSAALLDYLRSERLAYYAFLFLPYMFEASVLGVSIVKERAWLQPCLHDEAAAYLPQIAAMFREATNLLFNSPGEFETALRLFGPGIYSRSHVVGEGIEHDEEPARESDLPAELRGKHFVLYLGRRDRTKNVDLLARAFAQFTEGQPGSELELVLAGPGAESFTGTAGLHDLGHVSAESKRALLNYCVALAQPSRHESFSRTMMEAWMLGRPVLVQGDCLATARAVQDCGGGWLATNESEWAGLFAQIAGAGEEELTRRGNLGRGYAAEHADWDRVIARYKALLDLAGPGDFDQTPEPRTIHQLLPDIVFGDAISNQAIAIRDHLRARGYQSEIFVKRREQQMSSEATLWEEAQPSPTDELIYHHSIGSELTEFAIEHRGPKCLVYHNITPAGFFAAYRPGFAWMLETGRAQLSRLAPHFPISVGDSAYNAAELAANGFHAPGVLPIIVDPDKWNIAPNEELMRRLQDGSTNLLFVGRVAPNKQPDKLVEAFRHYRDLDQNSRLIIVGEGRASDPYVAHLHALIEELGLSSCVEITGQVDDAALLAYYHTAHLYWSASAHEGFGAPLIESMWFDAPVLALNASAVPETLGGAGVLFDVDEEPAAVAARAYQLIQDKDLRATVIAMQRKRRADFGPDAVRPHLDKLIEQLASFADLSAGVPA